jgi:hypothetical protein
VVCNRPCRHPSEQRGHCGAPWTSVKGAAPPTSQRRPNRSGTCPGGRPGANSAGSDIRIQSCYFMVATDMRSRRRKPGGVGESKAVSSAVGNGGCTTAVEQ